MKKKLITVCYVLFLALVVFLGVGISKSSFSISNKGVKEINYIYEAKEYKIADANYTNFINDLKNVKYKNHFFKNFSAESFDVKTMYNIDIIIKYENYNIYVGNLRTNYTGSKDKKVLREYNTNDLLKICKTYEVDA